MTTSFPTGLDNFTNPTAADNLDTPGVTHADQHANNNDAIEALEAKLGINLSSVATSLDYIAKLVLLTQTEHPSGAYAEVTMVTSKVWPQTVIWYTDSGKTIKLIEKAFTYGLAAPIPTQIEMKLYDGTVANTVVRTITDVITYDRVFEVSRARTVA
ncbi:MAG: hypothetical protein WC761_01775 [Candidatus Paceibacterota bacterium]|jgi:hypothetical protein